MDNFAEKTITANTLNKQNVAECFAKAANDYDDAAYIQRVIGRKLERWLTPCHALMDLGCGTGFNLPQLSQFSQYLIAADISEQMLNKVRERQQPDCHLIQQDAESLSLSTGCVDGIFSNMALQWCDSLSACLSECYRVLNQNGYMLFTTLLDGSLGELKTSWAQVDNFRHVNQFLTKPEILAAIQGSGFTLAESQVVTETAEYHSVMDVLRSLKRVGANHVTERQNKGMTGKKDFQRLAQAYENYRNSDGMLPMSYQVFYCKLIKKDRRELI